MANKLEKPATIALADREGQEGWVLDGLYRAGESDDYGGAVVAPPHPLYGGSMDSPVVTQIGFTCEKAGIASLRFNWRGAGASAGALSGSPDDALEDYNAALDFLEETVSPPLVAAGYSYGAATALTAGERVTVRRLALVAPPPSMIDVARLEAFKGKVYIAVGENDSLASAKELQAITKGLSHVRLEVLEDTDHFFTSGPGLSVLHQSLSMWLEP